MISFSFFQLLLTRKGLRRYLTCSFQFLSVVTCDNPLDSQPVKLFQFLSVVTHPSRHPSVNPPSCFSFFQLLLYKIFDFFRDKLVLVSFSCYIKALRLGFNVICFSFFQLLLTPPGSGSAPVLGFSFFQLLRAGPREPHACQRVLVSFSCYIRNIVTENLKTRSFSFFQLLQFTFLQILQQDTFQFLSVVTIRKALGKSGCSLFQFLSVVTFPCDSVSLGAPGFSFFQLLRLLRDRLLFCALCFSFFQLLQVGGQKMAQNQNLFQFLSVVTYVSC